LETEEIPLPLTLVYMTSHFPDLVQEFQFKKYGSDMLVIST